MVSVPLTGLPRIFSVDLFRGSQLSADDVRAFALADDLLIRVDLRIDDAVGDDDEGACFPLSSSR